MLFLCFLESNLPEWLQSLIMCCFEVSEFDIQSSSVGTLLDLIILTLSVNAGHAHGLKPSAPVVVVPMISRQALGVIEKSDLYQVELLECESCIGCDASNCLTLRKRRCCIHRICCFWWLCACACVFFISSFWHRFQVIAESLWDQLKEDTTQFHQRIVELYLQLHNLTASPSLCANVIGNSLIDISKVNTRQLLHQDEKMRYYFLVLSCYLHSIARVALDW